jgi:hypothetical protein
VFDPTLQVGGEFGEVAANWTLPTLKGLPVVLKIRKIHANGKRATFHIAQAGLPEQA